jgi:O-antigen ligase/polysaccharide polymerase Wzy-like membrane protein
MTKLATGVLARWAEAARAERPRGGTLLALGLVAGAAVAAALRLLGGRADGALWIGFVVALGCAVVARPRAGYYLLLSIVILADDWMLYFSPWTHHVLGYSVFGNWWKLLSPDGIRRFGGLVNNTVEILLVALVIGVTVRVVREGDRLVRPREAVFAILYLATLIGMLVYGLATGGALKPALWQSRYLFHFVVVALLTPQILRTSAQVRGAVWALMIPVVVKALQILWIFFANEGGRFGEWREILGHEDSNFFVSAIILGAVLALYRVEPLQRWFLVSSLPFLLAGLVLNLRRAAYVTLAFGLALLPVLLHDRRRIVLKLTIPALLLVGLYAAVYWYRPADRLGLPLQKAKSVFVAPVGSSDYNSNLYRVAENFNVEHTVLDHPWGLGFGHPFDIQIPLPDISLLIAHWQYRPHNTILGIWMSLGTPGFIVFLVYLASILALASHHARWQTDAYFRAVSFWVLAAFACGFVFATVDMYVGIQRGAVFLGALAGILSAIDRLAPARQGPVTS